MRQGRQQNYIKILWFYQKHQPQTKNATARDKPQAGTQALVNTGSGLCLDPPGAGAPPAATDINGLTCLDPSSSDNQEFRLEDSGQVKYGQAEYFVKHALSGDCLDISGLAADGTDQAVGQNVTLFTCSADDDHLWVFQAA